MNFRRWYAPTVLAFLALGGWVFFAASRTWLSANVRAAGLPSDLVTVTEADAQPLIPALGLVIAAAGLAVLATRGRLRQLVGFLVTAAAVGIVIAVATGADTRLAALNASIDQSTAFTGDNRPSPHEHEWLLWTVVLAALLAFGLGVLTMIAARAWPAMSGRYDAPRSSGSVAIEPERADGADLWKALDEGHDPTV